MKIAKQLFLLIGLIKIGWTDHQKRLISNTKLGKLLCVRGFFLVLTAYFSPGSLREELQSTTLGFVSLGIFFLCFYYMSKKRIGAGDVKLMAVLGAFCGEEEGLFAAFFATVYALIRGLIDCINKKSNLGKEFPFAPYVFWGTVTVLFGEISGITW